MRTEVLPIHSAALFKAAVARAADLLRAGQLVALPTETVYGLAANACDAAAVGRIYEVKGRPRVNPIIVHVAGMDMARRCVTDWPDTAAKLAAAFWPGPLTLVLPRAPEIPDIVTAGGATVGVRWPSNPFIQAVIRACGFPLAAPSANLAGRVSPTLASHVARAFSGAIPLIVDGGPAHVGIESSVLDLTASPPRLLRPGMVNGESLAAVLQGDGIAANGDDSSVTPVLLSPGLLRKHYSPRARLVVLHWKDEDQLSRHIAALHCAIDKIHVLAHDRIPLRAHVGRVAVIPHDAEAFARALYAELHHCDEAGAQWIIVEAPPAGEAWRAIADRLARAAARDA